MKCPKCQTKIEIEDFNNKVSFRATCTLCDADLHVCINCKYYTIGKPADCYILDIEPIADKEKNNLCEQFKPKEEKNINNTNSYSKKDAAKKLFGDDKGIDGGDIDFKSLFKD